eukprot:8297877-Pyramimonas_sp.AAC.1
MGMLMIGDDDDDPSQLRQSGDEPRQLALFNGARQAFASGMSAAASRRSMPEREASEGRFEFRAVRAQRRHGRTSVRHLLAFGLPT